MQGHVERRERFGIDKGDRPRHIGLDSITTTREKTPPTSNRLPQGQTGREHIGHLPDGQFVFDHVVPGHRHRADQPAVKDQSAFPEFEDFDGIRQKVTVLDDNIKSAASHQSGEGDIKTQVQDSLLVQSILFRPAGGQQDSGKKARGHQQAVGENLEV